MAPSNENKNDCLIESSLNLQLRQNSPHIREENAHTLQFMTFQAPPTDRGNPQVFINGSYLKRSWVRSHENVALLVANSVNSAGDRKIITTPRGTPSPRSSGAISCPDSRNTCSPACGQTETRQNASICERILTTPQTESLLRYVTHALIIHIYKLFLHPQGEKDIRESICEQKGPFIDSFNSRVI